MFSEVVETLGGRASRLLSEDLRTHNGTPCWIWSGSRVNGYGKICRGGKKHRLHRLVYELFAGPIPDGLELDHLCRRRACCNPAHLEPVTRLENVRRGEKPARTICPKGHVYVPNHVRMRVRTLKSGEATLQRECAICYRESKR